MSVVEFRRKEAPPPDEPTVEGAARCLTCAHEWRAVAPPGVLSLECPACHLMRGAWVYVTHLPDGATHWRCKCDCIVFAVDRKGIVCCACGIRTSFMELADA